MSKFFNLLRFSTVQRLKTRLSNQNSIVFNILLKHFITVEIIKMFTPKSHTEEKVSKQHVSWRVFESFTQQLNSDLIVITLASLKYEHEAISEVP